MRQIASVGLTGWAAGDTQESAITLQNAVALLCYTYL